MVYEKNMVTLKEYYRVIYDKIMHDGDVDDSHFFAIETAKNGEKTIKYIQDGHPIYLNSKYNPTNEADKYMSDTFDMPDESILIMFGISNGTYVRSYLKHVKKHTICVVYEPSIDIFKNLIHEVDISDLISSDRVHIVIEGINENTFSSVLDGRIQVYNKDNNRCMAAPYYIELYPDAYKRFKRILIDIYEKLYIITNTAINYGKRVVRNDIGNMRYLPGCRSSIDFIGKFPEGLPAIVVAAGPSLDKNIDVLKKAKGKALIIVVDTAIKRVLKAGIIPDMIISIDMEKPVEMFEGENLAEIPFLVDMDANIDVLDYVRPKNLIFCSSDSVIWDDLFKRAGSEIRVMQNGGSVATAAISVLIEWGFKRIILMGMDLGFTSNKLYAGSESQEIDADEDRYTYVKGIYEDKILVRKDYYIYLKWIEKIAGYFSDIEFIDATEGGTLKENTQIMTLHTAIDRYCLFDYDIKKIVEAVPRLFDEEGCQLIKSTLVIMKDNLNRLRNQLVNCSAECQCGKEILESGLNNIEELKRINLSIKEMDDAIAGLHESVYITKYMTDAEVIMLRDMFDEEDNHIQESIRMYEKSKVYYDKLSDGIPDIIKIIEDCLSKM